MTFSSAKEVEQAFYQAFTRLDLAGMRTVWSSTAEVSCLHPGRSLIAGLNAVLSSWAAIFEGGHPPDIRCRVLHVVQRPEVEIRIVEETIGTGGQGAARVIATNIYQRESDGWYMLLHHATNAPAPLPGDIQPDALH